MDFPKRVLVFTDMGLDDIMAILFLMKKLPKDVRMDIICVGGNYSAYDSFKYACGLSQTLHRNNTYIWKTDNIPQNYLRIDSIHKTELLKLKYYNKCNTIELKGNSITITEKSGIIILAPCTIPVMLNINPLLVERLVIMGGGISQTNYEGFEFNQYIDKTSFSDFIEKFISQSVVITLDCCRNEMFSIYHSHYQEILPNNSVEYNCYRLYETLAKKRGSKYCIAYDLIAAYAFVYPEKMITESRKLIGVNNNIEPCCVTKININSSEEFWMQIWRNSDV